VSTRSARPARTARRPITTDALGPGSLDRVRARLLAELRASNITTLRTDVVYGTARRPG